MSTITRRSRVAGSTSPTTRPWRTRITEHALVAPDTLLAHPQNWRRHPESQRRALRAALGEVGWVQGVIVNRTTERILDGHARVEEAAARGELVPVTFVELDEPEERLVLATFDAIGSLAMPDPAAFGSLLAALQTQDADLADLLTGLAKTFGVPADQQRDPDAIPALPDEAATHVRRGQVWQLGPHRIACGDALDAELVKRLLAGERPTLLVTDPPYGVSLDLARRHALDERARPDRRRGRGHRVATISGDDRADWSAAYALVRSLAAGYVWHPALTVGEVIDGLERLGFELVSEIIWAKSRWAVGQRWYHWQHEGCLVVRRRGARVRFLGGHDQGTLWEAPSPKVGGPGADPKVDHPAQKPVMLFERPIRNHLAPGGLAYDPFLGSGTALIAAEVSHRRCLGIELDPRFVQLVIERWQALTDERAELVDEGS